MRLAIKPKLNRFKRTATTATFAIMIVMIMPTAAAMAFSTMIVSAAALMIRLIVPAPATALVLTTFMRMTATAFMIFVVMVMTTAATATTTTAGMHLLGTMILATATTTAAMPLTAATAAGFLLIFEKERAAFKLGYRFCSRCRVGSKSPDTALSQGHFGLPINASAQNGINPEILACTAALVAQGNMHVLAGIGIEKHQVLGVRQVRLNHRLRAVRGCYWDTEFHFLAFQKQ